MGIITGAYAAETMYSVLCAAMLNSTTSLPNTQGFNAFYLGAGSFLTSYTSYVTLPLGSVAVKD